MSIYIAKNLLSVWMKIKGVVARCEKDWGCEKEWQYTVVQKGKVPNGVRGTTIRFCSPHSSQRSARESHYPWTNQVTASRLLGMTMKVRVREVSAGHRHRNSSRRFNMAEPKSVYLVAGPGTSGWLCWTALRVVIEDIEGSRVPLPSRCLRFLVSDEITRSSSSSPPSGARSVLLISYISSSTSWASLFLREPSHRRWARGATDCLAHGVSNLHGPVGREKEVSLMVTYLHRVIQQSLDNILCITVQ